MISARSTRFGPTIVGILEDEQKYKISLKFAKEFFITPHGEIIKMAAMVSPSEEVRGYLIDQSRGYKYVATKGNKKK